MYLYVQPPQFTHTTSEGCWRTINSDPYETLQSIRKINLGIKIQILIPVQFYNQLGRSTRVLGIEYKFPLPINFTTNWEDQPRY